MWGSSRDRGRVEGQRTGRCGEEGEGHHGDILGMDVPNWDIPWTLHVVILTTVKVRGSRLEQIKQLVYTKSRGASQEEGLVLIVSELFVLAYKSKAREVPGDGPVPASSGLSICDGGLEAHWRPRGGILFEG